MLKYSLKTDAKKSSRAYGRNLRISTKSSIIVCRVINGMRLGKAESLLEGLVSGKRSLKGKHYTKTSGELLGLLKSARSNADAKGLDADAMIVMASANRGFRMWTPRRFKLRRTAGRNTNVQMVLRV